MNKIVEALIAAADGIIGAEMDAGGKQPSLDLGDPPPGRFRRVTQEKADAVVGAKAPPLDIFPADLKDDLIVLHKVRGHGRVHVGLVNELDVAVEILDLKIDGHGVLPARPLGDERAVLMLLCILRDLQIFQNVLVLRLKALELLDPLADQVFLHKKVLLQRAHVHRRAVAANGLERKVQALELDDHGQAEELLIAVVAIVVYLVDIIGLKEADLVVIAQRLRRNAEELGELRNGIFFFHVSKTTFCRLL